LGEIAKAAASAFDRFILRSDDDARGRDRDQITGLLRKGLVAAGVDPERIIMIPDEQEAIDAALGSCELGDLLVIFGDKISRCWKQITKFSSDGKPRPDGEQSELAELPSKPIELAGSARPWELGGTLVEDERGVRIVREVED
ncbi:MAG: cyanophycin synthetase, partial [Deltaproteobacteria bacterium]|nr:cyanophycin synthetase [Nannocystaceae bacterium]